MREEKPRARTRILSLAFLGVITLTTCKDFSVGEFFPHVYLTFRSEDVRSSLQVNYHSMDQDRPSKVYYDTVPRNGDLESYQFQAEGAFDSLEGTTRKIHHVELKNLSPGTTYYFAVDEEAAREFKFTTLSANGPIRMITGGDMGTGPDMDSLTALAGSYDPDVILIGGDIAYANGKRENTGIWDQWLRITGRNFVDPNGNLIPMILALGNHETDFLSAMKPYDKAPFFYRLFSQTGADGKTYFSRVLRDDVVLLALDSGFISPAPGPQAAFVKKHLKRGHRFKMAIYHAPLYPAHRGFNLVTSLVPRLAWRPLFDKYGLTLGMENHDHAMKRTHYLKKDKPVDPSEGTLYIGDGCFGKNPREVHPERDYLAVARSEQHFWVVDILEDSVEYLSVGMNNVILDQHVQSVALKQQQYAPTGP